MRTYQVRLEDVRFFGYHGLFPEERILGNWFLLTISITKYITQDFQEDIDRSMDYGQLYQISADIMEKPVDLLETLCETMASKFKEIHPDFVELEIKICKEQPPMGMLGGRACVVWKENSVNLK
jgi:dihydroneopterin aldolase